MSWAKAIGASVQTSIAAGAWVTDKYNEKKDIKNRPKYEIPQEAQANLSDAQRMAMQGLPEEQKQEYLKNIERSQAYNMSQIGTRKGGLAGVAALNQNASDQYGKLLSVDAQQRMQNQGVLMNQRQNMADYKDQQWQLNTLNPYYEHIARRDARNGAVQKSSMNAAQSFGGGGGGGMGMGGGGNRMSQQPQQQQPQAQSVQNSYMSPYQMNNNYTTVNPYANQQSIDVNGGGYKGSSYWGQ